MKRGTLIFIPFAIPLIALDVALIATGKLTAVSLLSSVATFAVIVFLYWFFNHRGRRVGTDERTVKVARKAMAYSWLFSIYVVCLLSASDTLGLLRLSGLQYLGIVVQTMAFSYLILHLVMSRKGDVE